MSQVEMTRQERQDLTALIRKRERVLKAAVAERSAALIAEFEKQLASTYSFNDDAVWAEAKRRADEAVRTAQEEVARRCAELGIPREFAPGLHLGWYERGQNAVARRRDELRKVAKARADSLAREAITKIERQSLEAQTEVTINGLQSDAARTFLGNMKGIDDLMPEFGLEEVKPMLVKGGG